MQHACRRLGGAAPAFLLASLSLGGGRAWLDWHLRCSEASGVVEDMWDSSAAVRETGGLWKSAAGGEGSGGARISNGIGQDVHQLLAHPWICHGQRLFRSQGGMEPECDVVCVSVHGASGQISADNVQCLSK